MTLAFGFSLFFLSSLLGLGKAAPQFNNPTETEGIIAPSILSGLSNPLTPSATRTYSYTPAPSASSGYNQAYLDRLWSSVEVQLPVTQGVYTSVQNVTFNATSGPETPMIPTSLQDHAANQTFPKGFAYGVAQAAFQVEGAVKADGKGPSTWDFVCHTYPAHCNNYTGDVTTEFYYLYKNDIARVKAMGVNTFSLTLAWSRIFPFGSGPVNQAGVEFYDNVISTLLANNIKPIVTLFHWDAPLATLVEYGAFLNQTIATDFANYAEFAFKRWGQNVTTWITFNEPRVYCSKYQGLPFSEFYPAGVNTTIAPYPCTANTLIAHGMAVQRYRNLVNNGTIAKGEIAFKNDDSHPIPYNSTNPDDIEAADRHFQFFIGIFSQPVYVNGTYPDVVLNTLPASVLPRLTQEQQAMINGSADFYAYDGYRTNAARAAPNGISTCLANISDPNWPVCQDGSDQGQYTLANGFSLGPVADVQTSWLYNTAPLLRYQLQTLKSAYNYTKIYISEYGFARQLEYMRTELYQITYDSDRAQYFVDYCTAMLDAIYVDKIPLAGAIAWSYVDNMEWESGLEQRFGLQFVNQTDQSRQWKLSFLLLRDFMKAHLDPSDYNGS